jgi:glutathione S-transferase
MKLWSGTLSPFSTKVRIALAEKGLTAEIAEIPWSRASLWGPKPKAFLSVSPKGEVPVLEDEGLAIVDSTVINEYLEEAYPDTPLMPAEPPARAECRMWEDMADHHMASQLTILIREVFMKPEEERDAALVAATIEHYGGYLGAMERRLADRDYLCGAFGLADIASWIGLAFAQTLGVDTSQLPAVQAWYARVGERPAVAAEFEQIMAAAAAA